MELKIKTSQGLQPLCAVQNKSPSIDSMDKMIVDSNIIPITSTVAYYNLSAANTDVTCCTVASALSTSNNSGLIMLMCIPYAMSNENCPGFFAPSGSNQLYAAFYGRDVELSGITSDVNHVYTISINATLKQAKFYVDGVLMHTDSQYSNSGNKVIIGSGTTDMSDFAGRKVQCKYFGVIESCQSDADIIAKQQELMAKYNIS